MSDEEEYVPTRHPPIRRTPAEIRVVDAKYKGPDFDRDADRLWKLYKGQGRDLVLEHLNTVKMGDRRTRDPVMIGTVATLVRSISVLYSAAATRILHDGAGKPVPPDAPAAKALAAVVASSDLDAIWSEIDEVRTCLRQCLVVYASSVDHGGIVARIFPPQVVFRQPDPAAADLLERDEAFALLLQDASEERGRVYQLWQRDDAGWCCWVVTGDGLLEGDQPFGDKGRVPYVDAKRKPVLPAALVVDAPLNGRAYHPIPQPRLTTSMAIDALANDLVLLIRLEAHTQKAIHTSNPAGVPDESGPDGMWVLGPNDKIELLGHSPKILEAATLMDRLLSALALSEGLPPTAFSYNRQIQTGAALRVEERDLDRRRRRLGALTANQERAAYRKMAAILALDAGELELEPLDPNAKLIVTHSQGWASVDIQSQQEVSLKEVAAGTRSLLEHDAEMRGISLDEARALWPSTQRDRADYPAPAAQNPGALVDSAGARAALGEASAKKNGGFNPDIASSVEGASVIAAVQQRAGEASL